MSLDSTHFSKWPLEKNTSYNLDAVYAQLRWLCDLNKLDEGEFERRQGGTMAQSPHISVNSFIPHSLPSSDNDAPSTERSVKALQQYSMNSRAFIYSPSTGIEISIIANISTWRANNVEGSHLLINSLGIQVNTTITDH